MEGAVGVTVANRAAADGIAVAAAASLYAHHPDGPSLPDCEYAQPPPGVPGWQRYFATFGSSGLQPNGNFPPPPPQTPAQAGLLAGFALGAIVARLSAGGLVRTPTGAGVDVCARASVGAKVGAAVLGTGLGVWVGASVGVETGMGGLGLGAEVCVEAQFLKQHQLLGIAVPIFGYAQLHAHKASHTASGPVPCPSVCAQARASIRAIVHRPGRSHRSHAVRAHGSLWAGTCYPHGRRCACQGTERAAHAACSARRAAQCCAPSPALAEV